MTKTLDEKADEILNRGRLRVEKVDGALIVASCRSSEDETIYKLGFDPRNAEWRCTCPVVKKLCSHLVALQRITGNRPPEVIPS